MPHWPATTAFASGRNVKKTFTVRSILISLGNRVCVLDHCKIDVRSRTQGLTVTGGPASRGVAGITVFKLLVVGLVGFGLVGLVYDMTLYYNILYDGITDAMIRHGNYGDTFHCNAWHDVI